MTPGSTVDARDRYITREFKKYLLANGKSDKPFFAFLFYDSAHGYCSKLNIPKIFKPDGYRIHAKDSDGAQIVVWY